MIGTLDFHNSLKTTVSRVALAMVVSMTAPVVLIHDSAYAQGFVCTDAKGEVGGATANGNNSVACGDLAAAEGSNTVSLGYGAGVNPNGTDYDVAGGNGAAAATADNATAVGYGAVSNGDNGVALGYTARANGDRSIAIGGEARTGTAGDTTGNTGQNAVAIGYQAVAGTNGGTAIGQGAAANFLNSTALGIGAATSAENQMSFGTGTSIYRMQGLPSAASTAAQTGGSIKMVTVDASGNLATANIPSGGTTITGFKATNATGAAAVDPTVTGNNALAAGSGASTGAFNDAIALGQGATVTGNGGIAIGKGVTAGANQVVIGATGNTYRLGGLSATAATGFVLGIDQNGNLSVVQDQTGGGTAAAIAASGSTAGTFTAPTIGSNTNALAIGSSANAGANNAIALGANSSATGLNSIAIGQGVTTSTANRIQIGNASNTYALGGLKAAAGAPTTYLTVDANGVLGASTIAGGGDTTGIKLTDAAGGAALAATATGNFMTALGSGSSVTGENGVALGAKSVAGVHNTGVEGAGKSVTFGGTTFATNVQDANGVVSVSGGGINRQITGVADGALNATSTDAVNGGQLFGIASALDAKAGKIGTGLATSLGGGATVAPDGTLTGPSYAIGGTTYNSVGAALAALSTGAPAGTGFAANKAAAGDPNALAGGLGAVASGYGSSASAANSTALGQGAQATFANSAAIGAGSATTRENQMMFGTGTSTYTFAGLNSAASKAAVTGTKSFVGADANGNIATFTAAELGISGVVDGIAMTNATGGPPAMSTATGNNVTAIGSGASATVNNNVALGALSTANTAFNNGMETAGGASAVTIAGVALTNAQDANGVVSVSGGGINRQITGVADGALSATSRDAVNGAQLFGVATALDTKSGNIGSGLVGVIGGGAQVTANGTITGPTFSLSGQTTQPTTIAGAIEALDTRIDNLNVAGTTLVSGKDANGATANIVAAQTSGNNSTALGSGSSATGTNSLALGANSIAGTQQTVNSLTLGSQTVNTQVAAQGQASIGGTNLNRQLTGVADGRIAANSNDAVNGSQLFGVANALQANTQDLGSKVATALGGGATYTNGTWTAPSYTLGGTTHTSVGAALTDLQGRISSGGNLGFAANKSSSTDANAAASGLGAVASGYASVASGANSTAIGQGARATNANSTAIGTGATTERDNQIVYGKADGSNTHTMKGTTSTASQGRVATTGSDTYIMVTNAAGDVAAYRASDLNLGGSSELRNDVAGLRKDVNKAFKQIDENTQGIAVAIAMTGALTLPVNHNFGISANWGNYEGKNAFSSTAALRLSEHLVASGALGVGLDTGSVGTRLGMQLTW